MEKFVLGIYVGVVVYVLTSAVIDIILFCIKSLNRKQLGTLGIILNIILFSVANLIRSMFPSEVLFYVICVISIINMIVSAIQITLGMMSCDARH